jgi:hypothetical protein
MEDDVNFRKALGWVLELLGLAAVVTAAALVSPVLGLALAGAALLALGYVVYGNSDGKVR